MGANVLNIFCFYDCVLQNKSDYLSARKMDGPHFVILDWGVGYGRASVCGVVFFFSFFFSNLFVVHFQAGNSLCKEG